MQKEEKEALDCLVMHLKTFHEQSTKKAMADFGEPCALCPQNESCGFNWNEKMEPLLRKSNIDFKMGRVELLDR